MQEFFFINMIFSKKPYGGGQKEVGFTSKIPFSRGLAIGNKTNSLRQVRRVPRRLAKRLKYA